MSEGRRPGQRGEGRTLGRATEMIWICPQQCLDKRGLKLVAPLPTGWRSPDAGLCRAVSPPHPELFSVTAPSCIP